MKELTRAKSWTVFLITVLPFLLAGTKPYGYYFLLLGFFLTTYWIISVGKYGAVLAKEESKNMYTLFYITNRLIFIFYAASFLLMKYLKARAYNETIFILSIISMILGIAALLFTIVYSSVILEKLEQKKLHNNNIISNCILFILFPAGVWILQPRINKYIGAATL